MSFLWAFLGGLLSFLSPCILPVAPGWLGVISGSSLEELKEGGARRRRVLAATLAFIAGFSLVFIALGLASSFLGEALAAHRVLIARILGVIVIVFGLHQGGWLKLPFLYRERRVHRERSVGLWGAFLTGLAFSFGWTPCVGPILASILAIAGSEADPLRGVALLVVYSAGLALPFLALAFGFEKLLPRLSAVKPWFKYLGWFAGAMLVIIGILLVTDGLGSLSAWFVKVTGGWNPEDILGGRAPGR